MQSKKTKMSDPCAYAREQQQASHERLRNDPQNEERIRSYENRTRAVGYCLEYSRPRHHRNGFLGESVLRQQNRVQQQSDIDLFSRQNREMQRFAEARRRAQANNRTE